MKESYPKVLASFQTTLQWSALHISCLAACQQAGLPSCLLRQCSADCPSHTSQLTIQPRFSTSHRYTISSLLPTIFVVVKMFPTKRPYPFANDHQDTEPDAVWQCDQSHAIRQHIEPQYDPLLDGQYDGDAYPHTSYQPAGKSPELWDTTAAHLNLEANVVISTTTHTVDEADICFGSV